MSNKSKIEMARLTRITLSKQVGNFTSNRELLALGWKKADVPITLELINSLLPNKSEFISQELFDYFVSLDLDKPLAECSLPITQTDRKTLNSLIGSTESNSAIQVKGAYYFRFVDTNELLYIGSSKHIGMRGPQYLVASRQAHFGGAWGQYIRSNPSLTGVKMAFFDIPLNLEQHFLALEQYLLLKYTSRFNQQLCP